MVETEMRREEEEGKTEKGKREFEPSPLVHSLLCQQGYVCPSPSSNPIMVTAAFLLELVG